MKKRTCRRCDFPANR